MDPYSSSKAGVEMIVQAYRESYRMILATARAGNAIGGGDWGENRLLPDLMKALLHGRRLQVRHPSASRPWQHVLDLCWGYSMLSSRLLRAEGVGAWNFGPSESVTVQEIIDAIPLLSGQVELARNPPQEDLCLRLDSSSTMAELGWANRLDWRASIDWTVEDYRLLHADPEKMESRMEQRLLDYSSFWEVLN
jgi:CDP-glucose 4,6-dehydratase